MYAPERHREIVDRVGAAGRASVVDLAEALAVTPETIRRDLSVLERQGLVRRVHGGAIPVRRAGILAPADTRTAVLIEEKGRIAEAALQELPKSGAIIIDSGTTTGRLVSILPHGRHLTVVTNSVQHAIALAGRQDVTCLLLGGRVRGRTLACVDNWALDGLRDLTVDVAFIGASGVTAESGLTTPDRVEAEIKAAMINAARRTVVLADHSKFGADAFAKFAKLEEIDVVISDSGLDKDAASSIAAAGLTLVLA